MDSYVLIGKIVNTHGIKGELRIISDFELKEKVFAPGIKIYIGKEKDSQIIKSNRNHKMFELVTLEGFDNINQVLKYKNKFVYVKKSVLSLAENEFLMQELVGYEVVEFKESYGKIVEIVKNNSQTLLLVEGNKKFYLPYVKKYIEKVDTLSKKIYTKDIEELIF